MNNYPEKKGAQVVDAWAPSRDMPSQIKYHDIIQSNFNKQDYSFKNMGLVAGYGSFREYQRGKVILESLNLSPDKYYLLILDLSSTFERLAKGHLVSIFQVTTDRQAPSDAG